MSKNKGCFVPRKGASRAQSTVAALTPVYLESFFAALERCEVYLRDARRRGDADELLFYETQRRALAEDLARWCAGDDLGHPPEQERGGL